MAWRSSRRIHGVVLVAKKRAGRRIGQNHIDHLATNSLADPPYIYVYTANLTSCQTLAYQRAATRAEQEGNSVQPANQGPMPTMSPPTQVNQATAGRRQAGGLGGVGSGRGGVRWAAARRAVSRGRKQHALCKDQYVKPCGKGGGGRKSQRGGGMRV